MSQSADRPRVLVVDDSRTIRESLRRFLESDYDVETAKDGQEAWARLDGQGDVDLLITDISMPNMDGYSLICRVRDSGDDEALSRMPIVVITGLEDEVTRLRAFACGADNFIQKPLKGDTLRDSVADQLDQGTTRAASDVLASMTQLLDAEGLTAHGEEAVRRSRESGEPFAIISIQISPLDDLEAQFGSEMVQQLRLWLADLLIKKRREGDQVAQLDNAAFAILAPGSDQREAMVTAERIYSAFASDPFPNPRVAGVLQPKIGYAALGEDGADDLAALVNLAETRRDSRQQMVDMGVDESVIEEPTVEEALTMLANQEDGKLLPYAAQLSQRVLPLLDLCNEQLDLGLDEELATIRARIRGELE